MQALITVFLSLLSAQAQVKDPIYDEYEGLPLIELLIRDGRLDLAENEIGKIEIKSDRTLIISGDLAFARQDFSKALQFYQRTKNPERLRLARTFASLSNWSKCIVHFVQSQGDWLNQERDSLLKAKCEIESGQRDQANTTLMSTFERFQSFSSLRELVANLLSLKIHQVAADLVMNQENLSSGDLMALAELFYQNSEPDLALLLLEKASLQKTEESEPHLARAKIYYEKQLGAATADAFERAAWSQSEFFHHASEVHRQLGHSQTSQYLSMFVADEKATLHSRIGQSIETNKYPSIASMENILMRSALKQDSEILYALGYSLFQMGEARRSLKYLSLITKADLLARSNLLKKTITEAQ